MLAVYESIDLGVIAALNKASPQTGQSLLDLVQGNHPSFLLDPIHDDNVYVYHAFGVHALDLAGLLKSLAVLLRDSNDESNNNSSLETYLITNPFQLQT